MKSKIEVMFEKFINFKDIHLKSFYLSKKEFLNDYEIYIKNHQDKKDLLEAMKNTVTIGQRSYDNLSVFSINESYANTKVSEYVIHLQELYLLYLDNKDAAYRRARHLNSKTSYNTKIARFEKRFYNSILYMNVFNDIENHMIEKKKRTTYVDSSLIKQYHIDINVIMKIYESNMSLLDYAYYNEIDFQDYSCYIRHATNNFAKEINSRVDTVTDKITDLIVKISNEEIDFIDYYKECKLKPGALRRFLSDAKVHGAVISSFIKDSRRTPIIESRELEGKLVINSVEVPRSIKEQAIEELKSINAPLTARNYKTLVRRYMNNN